VGPLRSLGLLGRARPAELLLTKSICRLRQHSPREKESQPARWRARCNYACKWQFTRLLLTADSITKTFETYHFYVSLKAHDARARRAYISRSREYPFDREFVTRALLTPKGQFKMVLRGYQPKAEMIDLRFRIPAVERLD
jgi:hypothetical protein